MTTTRTVKTMHDLKADLSELYDGTRDGEVDLRLCAELTNISGKYLKALALEQAREEFLAAHPTRA